MAKLTAKSIENIKPGPARREIPDAGCTGLYLISQAAGVKSWAVRYRYAGRPVKLTLGKWPAMSLADARKAAAEAQHELARGNNPAKAKADAKIKADAAQANTLTAVCENYLAIEGKKLRSRDARVSILRRHVYPALGDRPIGEIRRRDIARLLDKVEVGAGPRMADVTLGVLRRIFHWYELRDDEFRSPIIRGMQRQKTSEHRRTRVLDDDELRAVWAATADTSTFSALIRFLLLTGARRNEAAGMTWNEVDANGVWKLPAFRSKTKAEVERPLSKAARAILAELPRIDGCPFVFTTIGRTPISQFSIPKARLDAASGVTGWRLHDARRTARSLLSRCKDVTVDHAERVLGHARPDLIERYDRHDYIEEMRFAVEALSALITTIVNPPAADVADMAAERARRQRRRR
jgi:integrase